MKKIFAITVLFFLVTGTLAAKETKKYVSVTEAVVKEKPSMFGASVGSLAYGDVVLVQEEKGRFSRIEAVSGSTGKTLSGWVETSSLQTKKIVAKGSKVSASADELALAGKGFSPEVEAQYKKSGKTDYTSVDAVEKNDVTDNELLKFITEGSLEGADE